MAVCRWASPDPINSEWYNLSQGNGDRNLERDFLELAASPYEYDYDNPINYTDETGEQPNTKQKVQAYTNPDIKKFEASIAVNQQKFDKTRQQYIEHYISIGKINSKSSAGEIEKAFSPENMKELSRLQGLINKNKALLIEAKKIEAQWNKLDRQIEDVVYEYNNLKGLKGNNRLDPNLLKALMFTETEMGAGIKYNSLRNYIINNRPDALYQLNLGRVTDYNMYNDAVKEFKIPVNWKVNYKDNGNINDVRLAAGALLQKYEYAKKVGVRSKNNAAWFNAIKAFKGVSTEGEQNANNVWKLYTTGNHPHTSGIKLFNKR